jgi:hypothetical protein
MEGIDKAKTSVRKRSVVLFQGISVRGAQARNDGWADIDIRLG